MIRCSSLFPLCLFVCLSAIHRKQPPVKKKAKKKVTNTPPTLRKKLAKPGVKTAAPPATKPKRASASAGPKKKGAPKQRKGVGTGGSASFVGVTLGSSNGMLEESSSDPSGPSNLVPPVRPLPRLMTRGGGGGGEVCGAV